MILVDLGGLTNLESLMFVECSLNLNQEMFRRVVSIDCKVNLGNIRRAPNTDNSK